MSNFAPTPLINQILLVFKQQLLEVQKKTLKNLNIQIKKTKKGKKRSFLINPSLT